MICQRWGLRAPQTQRAPDQGALYIAGLIPVKAIITIIASITTSQTIMVVGLSLYCFFIISSPFSPALQGGRRRMIRHMISTGFLLLVHTAAPALAAAKSKFFMLFSFIKFPTKINLPTKG